MLGWSASVALRSTVSKLIVPERLRERHQAGLRRFLASKKSVVIGKYLKVTARHCNGHELPITLKVTALTIGDRVYFSAAIRDNLDEIDMTGIGTSQAALLDLANESMVACDTRMKILFWNNGAERLYGYRREEAIGRLTYELLKSVYPIPLAEIRKILWRDGCWEGEIIHRDVNGKAITTLSRWALEYDTYGEPIRILLSNTDITHTKEYLQKVEYLATHDRLTSLPNRILLEKRMDEAIAKARDGNDMMAIMFLDLNRFKVVNDSLGHQQGDLLLTVIAQRLLNVVRDGDTVARIGGDEFVICLHKVDDVTAINEIGDRVLKTVSQPINLNGQDAVVSTSIGVSIYPKDGTEATLLLKHADMAMYQSKAHGQGHLQFYSEELNARALDRFHMENALRAALERHEFDILYQPIVDAWSDTIVSVEALIRWNHPEKGLLLPADFIPLAEEIDLIGKLGEWMIHTVCAQIVAWRSDGLCPFRVSINVSPRQLRSASLVEALTYAIGKNVLTPGLLEIEITESALMENIEFVDKTLLQIRELGILLAIDDFGTGYSSLSHLKKLPIDTLKIDRSFINNVCTDPDDEAIVKATIGMAKTMQLRVVAEGVTTAQQVDLLKTAQCDALQGYHFSMPLRANALAALLSKDGRVATRMPAQ